MTQLNFLLQGPTRLQSKCQQTAFSSEDSTGEEFTSMFTQVIGTIHFLAAIGLEVWFYFWLLAGGHRL